MTFVRISREIPKHVRMIVIMFYELPENSNAFKRTSENICTLMYNFAYVLKHSHVFDISQICFIFAKILQNYLSVMLFFSDRICVTYGKIRAHVCEIS